MVNMAIIGCGYWGSNFVRLAKNSKKCKLSWCSDTLESNLENLIGESQTTTDYRDLLKDKNVEAVVIATPSETHYKIAMDCLNAGKDVLVEKPITTKGSEALELLKIAEKNKLILMVGHVFEFNPTVRKLKELMEKNELGEIFYINTARTGLGPIRKDVNALWDLATHDISILFYLLKEKPRDVVSRGECYVQKGIEDVVFLTIEFEKKILANLQVSWLDPYKTRKLTVVGSKKMAGFDDLNAVEPLRIFDKGVSYERKDASFGEFKILLRDGDILSPKIPATEPLKEEFNHFLECIEKRQKPLCDGYDGYRVVKVLEAADESLRNESKKTRINLEKI